MNTRACFALRPSLSSQRASADEALPRSIVALIREPVLMSSWVDTPKGHGVLLAMIDHHRMSDEDYFLFVRQMNQSQFASRICRANMSLASLLLAGSRQQGAIGLGTLRVG